MQVWLPQHRYCNLYHQTQASPLNTPAPECGHHHALFDISGERVEVAGEQILVNNRAVGSGRILLDDALVRGVVDEGSEGFINLGQGDFANIQEIDLAPSDADTETETEEQPEDSANIQTISRGYRPPS